MSRTASIARRIAGIRGSNGLLRTTAPCTTPRYGSTPMIRSGCISAARTCFGRRTVVARSRTMQRTGFISTTMRSDHPENSDHLILGSDGGVSISWDRSDNWYQFRNLPLGQFMRSASTCVTLITCAEDYRTTASWCAPSDTWSNQGIRTRDWYNVNGGDGFFTVMHPSNPGLMFAESQGGNLTRVNLETMERTRMRPIGRPGADEEMPDLRWKLGHPDGALGPTTTTPSTQDRTCFFGLLIWGRASRRSVTISRRAIDRDTLMIMGVPGGEAQMSRNDGQSSYGNLTAIAESPRDANVVYTGADDGPPSGDPGRRRDMDPTLRSVWMNSRPTAT